MAATDGHMSMPVAATAHLGTALYSTSSKTANAELATSDVVAIIHALEDVEFLDLTIDVSLARRARPRAPR